MLHPLCFPRPRPRRRRCDGAVCTDVCARGSVAIEPWLASAARLQAALVRDLPLCLTSLLGTHNSAITLADGYGNLDDNFRQYFKYIRWAVADFAESPLRTNDQWLSLTDQLNLGVRSVELDTHWVGVSDRIRGLPAFRPCLRPCCLRPPAPAALPVALPCCSCTAAQWRVGAAAALRSQGTPSRADRSGPPPAWLLRRACCASRTAGGCTWSR